VIKEVNFIKTCKRPAHNQNVRNCSTEEKEIYGHLDSPRTEAFHLGKTNRVSGWSFFSENRSVSKIKIFHGQTLIGTCESGHPREDVYQIYPFEQARRSGFKGEIALPREPLFPLVFVAEDETGNQSVFLKLNLWPRLLEETSSLQKLRRRTREIALKFRRHWEAWRRRGLGKPKRIVIVGFSKSGTTALVFKIKNSLPRNLKFLFEPKGYLSGQERSDMFVLAKILFWGIGIFSVQFLTKKLSHRVCYDDFSPFEKKIHLVRDPRDRLISGLLYYVRDSRLYGNDEALSPFQTLLEHKRLRPHSVSVTELIQALMELEGAGRALSDWRSIFQEYVNFGIVFQNEHPDYFVMKYEDVIDGKLQNLERYLGFPLPGPAAVHGSLDRVVRTKAYGDWKNWFLEEDVTFFKPIFSAHMEHFGYEENWKISPNPTISPDHSTEYVKRIILQKREEMGIKTHVRPLP